MFLGEPHVLVIHRKRHKDLSFPKGKVELGELLPITAVREVREETGLNIVLGAKLGVVNYDLPNGNPKEVHYWASQVTETEILSAISTFVPNKEVTALHWMSFAEARRKLSYAHDVDPLNRLEELLASDIRYGHTIIILRHGKALSRSSWGHSEATRPLNSKGKAQAKGLITTLEPWRPRALISSPWERCLRTIAPYSSAAGTPLAPRDKLTEASCAAAPQKTLDLVRHHAMKNQTVLFCTHRPVLPTVAEAISELLVNPDDLDRDTIAKLDTGAFSVINVGGSDADERFTLHSQEVIDSSIT